MWYTVNMACGHTQEMQLFGPTKEREEKIRYFELHGSCKECYKKEQREKELKQGLILNIDYGYIYDTRKIVDMNTGEVYLTLWFSGDTYTYKDVIKTLGYRWTENLREGYNAYGKGTNRWMKSINIDDYESEIAKIKEAISADFKIDDSLLDEFNPYGHSEQCLELFVSKIKNFHAKGEKNNV